MANQYDSNNSNGNLQIRYNRETTAGQVIEEFKDNVPHGTRSKIVRDLIYVIRGHEYLKNTNAHEDDIRGQLLDAISFFSANLEVSKLHYSLIENKISYRKLFEQQHEADEENYLSAIVLSKQQAYTYKRNQKNQYTL